MPYDLWPMHSAKRAGDSERPKVNGYDEWLMMNGAYSEQPMHPAMRAGYSERPMINGYDEWLMMNRP
ncbi:hypothetical protein F1880_008925 [Penicillium rolfsii]|nr:hypothetical protein F1880_008925 [Penicillium rolfsii]